MHRKPVRTLTSWTTRLRPARWLRNCGSRRRLLTGRQASPPGMLLLVACSVLWLVVPTPLSQAGDGLGLPAGNIYSDQSPPGQLDNLKTLLTVLIVPNIPGALMLLMLSSLFSSINFYTAVQSRRRTFRSIVGYLAAWIFFNYLFALLVLLLILPSDLSLSTINKTLFVYCLVATAMPEIVANLRLQLGDSTNAIDLYKYKTKVSDLITERLGTSVAEKRSQELLALAFFYYGRLDQFLDKLAVFSQQENLSSEEISDIEAIAAKLKERPVEGRASRVVELEREHQKIVPKLIQFFRDDIRRFTSSPTADLMDKLHPLLRIDEARKLVEAGVTSPRGFIWRCRFKSIRERLSKATDIDVNRLSILYYSTRVTERKRTLSRLKWMGSVAAVLVMAVSLIYWIQLRFLVDYRPDEAARSEIVSRALPQNGVPPQGTLGQTGPPVNSPATGPPE